MKLKEKVKFNKFVSVTSISTAVIVVILLACTGFMYAKYVKDMNFSGNVTISANLAESFTLLEHKVTQDSKGECVTGENLVESNEYKVLPGVDIIKDPTITITNKTNIPAYLYIEVVDSLDPEKVNYTLESYWKKLDGATPHTEGATVYVYCVDGTPYIFDGTTDDTFEINIIKDKKLTVTTHRNVGGSVDLTFHAYMKQVSDGSTATEVYNGVR